MSFSGIQGIDENFNGIQGINSYYYAQLQGHMKLLKFSLKSRENIKLYLFFFLD